MKQPRSRTSADTPIRTHFVLVLGIALLEYHHERNEIVLVIAFSVLASSNRASTIFPLEQPRASPSKLTTVASSFSPSVMRFNMKNRSALKTFDPSKILSSNLQIRGSHNSVAPVEAFELAWGLFSTYLELPNGLIEDPSRDTICLPRRSCPNAACSSILFNATSTFSRILNFSRMELTSFSNPTNFFRYTLIASTSPCISLPPLNPAAFPISWLSALGKCSDTNWWETGIEKWKIVLK